MWKKIKKQRIWMLLFFVCIMAGTGTVYASTVAETEPESAWVVASVYRDGSILFDGATSATMTAKVPYFDLSNYGLEDYILKDENGDTVEKPTLLHCLIYLIEKFSLQGEEANLGTGYYKDEIFKTERTGPLSYYVDTDKTTVTQSGGTMLSLDSNGKATSLWGFDDHEIRINLDRLQRKRNLHKVLLDEINTVELMLISEDNTRTILYPWFRSNTHQLKVGETLETNVSYYDIDDGSYDFDGTTALYMVQHLEKKESFDVNIVGDNQNGSVTAGPFNYVGIYKAKVILYPFYYKQLIEVRDTIEKVELGGDDGHFTTEVKTESNCKEEVTIIPDEFYDFSDRVKVTLADTKGTLESVTKNDDGTLTVCISYPEPEVNPPADEEKETEDGNKTEGDTEKSETEETKPEESVKPEKPEESTTTIITQVSEVKKGDKYTVSGAVYKVTKAAKKNGTVEYVKRTKAAKSVTIPATVKIKGVTYKVTSIAAKAFYNNKKLTKVTIGKNISKIGKNAFAKCKKLKTITIKTTKLIKRKVGSKAFYGIHAKATIKVPKNKVKVYKAILTARGAKKTVKVKK